MNRVTSAVRIRKCAVVKGDQMSLFTWDNQRFASFGPKPLICTHFTQAPSQVSQFLANVITKATHFTWKSVSLGHVNVNYNVETNLKSIISSGLIGACHYRKTLANSAWEKAVKMYLTCAANSQIVSQSKNLDILNYLFYSQNGAALPCALPFIWNYITLLLQ